MNVPKNEPTITRGFQCSFWQCVLCHSYLHFFMVEKYDFLKVVKIPYLKNRFLVNLRSFFSMYKFFPGRGWLFPVSTIRELFFNGKMSSLAGFKKKYLIFCKSTEFGHFWLPESTFKVHFLNVQAKFPKNSMVIFLGEVARNIVLKFALSISSGLRGVRQPFCRSTVSKNRDFC